MEQGQCHRKIDSYNNDDNIISYCIIYPITRFR